MVSRASCDDDDDDDGNSGDTHSATSLFTSKPFRSALMKRHPEEEMDSFLLDGIDHRESASLQSFPRSILIFCGKLNSYDTVKHIEQASDGKVISEFTPT